MFTSVVGKGLETQNQSGVIVSLRFKQSTRIQTQQQRRTLKLSITDDHDST